MAHVANMISRIAPTARVHGVRIRPNVGSSLRRGGVGSAHKFFGAPVRQSPFVAAPHAQRLHAMPVFAMSKKSVGDMTGSDLKGKTVFVRADLNVPLDGERKITDDTRVRAAVPTLKYLVDAGAKVLLTSHLGRPKSGPEDKFRLDPVVPRLSELLGSNVKKVDDCVGDTVKSAVSTMGDGEVRISHFLTLSHTYEVDPALGECAVLQGGDQKRSGIL